MEILRAQLSVWKSTEVYVRLFSNLKSVQGWGIWAVSRRQDEAGVEGQQNREKRGQIYGDQRRGS